MILPKETYFKYKEETIQGRYVIHEQLASFLETINDQISVDTIGYSVQNRPIQRLVFGNGKHKILAWSQMHGNESTTTKAVLDLINFLRSDSAEAVKILECCTLHIIPILNPDGAQAYTRVNANQIDLNRDAQDQSQPESKVLRAVYDDFKPDFCFNLHDQRTIFSAGATAKPATVSFLAPAYNEARSISETRAKSMKLIVAMNQVLQGMIPGQVGRYDDSFNANCIGDTFQMLGTPTVLFEAGHFQDDYQREKTRSFIFCALIAALDVIATEKLREFELNDYLLIPENQKLFVDVIVKNAHIIDTYYTSDVALLFVEALKGDQIHFESKIQNVENIKDYFGHKVYDCMIPSDLERLKNEDFWSLLAP